MQVVKIADNHLCNDIFKLIFSNLASNITGNSYGSVIRH